MSAPSRALLYLVGANGREPRFPREKIMATQSEDERLQA